jgi:hypothetical protein
MHMPAMTHIHRTQQHDVAATAIIMQQPPCNLHLQAHSSQLCVANLRLVAAKHLPNTGHSTTHCTGALVLPGVAVLCQLCCLQSQINTCDNELYRALPPLLLLPAAAAAAPSWLFQA